MIAAFVESRHTHTYLRSARLVRPSVPRTIPPSPAQAMHDWHNFSYETRNLYGVDMTPLSRQYEVRACVRAWAHAYPKRSACYSH